MPGMQNAWFALIACAFCSFACGKNNEPPPPSTGSPMAQTESGPSQKQPAATPPTTGGTQDEAAAMFASVCATCHGADGTGNGPASASLNPKPRNYTDAAWQASVTDDDLKKIILLGGQAVGKSAMMPANPNLRDKPEVIDGLVRIVRRFGAK
jgi:mono/diheme cytochrome c family protein